MSGTRTPAGMPEEMGVLAGEYVLGVLDAGEAMAVRSRAEHDTLLADAIHDWQNRLAPLAQLVPPVAPPAELWSRIAASIGTGSAAAPAAGAQPASPARGLPPAPSGFRGRNTGWKLTTGAAIALAAAFAAIAFLPRTEAPLRIAALAPTGGPAPAFLAQTQRDGSVILTSISPAEIPPDRDLELWLLPKDAIKVSSLGVLPSRGRRLPSAVIPRGTLVDGAQLLVSLEPKGGSPTGQPTGTVLYGGALITR